MKAILPVAGVGTRLRPLTHTQPKTLVHVAGKPILGHIVDRLLPVGVDEVVLIVGPWGQRVVDYVRGAYPQLKVTGVEQKEQKGLGHAIHMAESAFGPDEPALIVLGDTIFEANLQDAVQGGTSTIGVRRVENPSDFGVVEMDGQRVKRLLEKPEHPPTDLAIVGLYFVRQSGLLFECLGEIIEEDVRVKGEYQLTDGLQRMIERGEEIRTFPVEDWWDCGNPHILLETNRELLARADAPMPDVAGNVLIPPVAIDPEATIERSVVGPYVSVAAGAVVRDSVVRDAIVDENAIVDTLTLEHSLIGKEADVRGDFTRLQLGDTSRLRIGAAGQNR